MANIMIIDDKPYMSSQETDGYVIKSIYTDKLKSKIAEFLTQRTIKKGN